MLKNEEYIATAIDDGFEGEGIFKIDNMAVFAPMVIKGEKVKLKILKVNKKFAFAKAVEILEKSENREEPMCPVYGKCGGCNLMHVSYDYQKQIKKHRVETCLRKENIDVNVENCVGMGIPYSYRNKVQYPVTVDRDGKNIIGFYTKRSHNIIANKECYIQDEVCDKIAKNIFAKLEECKLKGYNEVTKVGDIRHIIVRRGYYTNEVMCVLVTKKENTKNIIELVNKILEDNANIKTIVQNINEKEDNKILGDKNKVLYGKGYIEDYIGDRKYKISASSFYQVNPVQTEFLYDTVKEYANLSGEEIVLDMYAGVGTIGIYLADKAKKVYGIEIVEEAVKMANETIKENEINNCEYICGDAGERLKEILEDNKNIDVTVVDPPRKGLDDLAIETLLNTNSKKIVYVSCNPATLARDLKKLEEKYNIEKVQPVDMFPQTSHVETVVLLVKKN